MATATTTPSALQTRILDYLATPTTSHLGLREGFLSGRRVFFVKGKHLVNALMRDTFVRPPQPDPFTRAAAVELVASLLPLTTAQGQPFLLRVDKEPGARQLRLSERQGVLEEDAFYLWLYQGNPFYRMAIGVGILAIIFIGVLFPLWPPFMRLGVYYLSLVAMGLLGALMGLGVIRWILWFLLTILLGRGGWLFPNLFADVGILDSFRPLWEWDAPRGGQATGGAGAVKQD